MENEMKSYVEKFYKTSDERMIKIIDYYYSNDSEKIRKTVDKILRKFGGISQKDYDDFYSLADEVFAKILKNDKYDHERSFQGYFYSCLYKKVCQEFTHQNRQKHKAQKKSFNEETGEWETEYISDVSLDVVINDDGETTFCEIFASDFDMNEEVFGTDNVKLLRYIDR